MRVTVKCWRGNCYIVWVTSNGLLLLTNCWDMFIKKQVQIEWLIRILWPCKIMNFIRINTARMSHVDLCSITWMLIEPCLLFSYLKLPIINTRWHYPHVNCITVGVLVILQPRASMGKDTTALFHSLWPFWQFTCYPCSHRIASAYAAHWFTKALPCVAMSMW